MSNHRWDGRGRCMNSSCEARKSQEHGFGVPGCDGILLWSHQRPECPAERPVDPKPAALEGRALRTACTCGADIQAVAADVQQLQVLLDTWRALHPAGPEHQPCDSDTAWRRRKLQQ